ncbi:MAG: hypothetical protein OEZ34_01270 [Spirochaetia bacterium]|nr:hypothetical protein [Spirochaetia bacterium]
MKLYQYIFSTILISISIPSAYSEPLDFFKSDAIIEKDALKVVDDFEIYLSSISDLFQRARVLAIQSANGIYTQKDRALLDLEFQEILIEIKIIRNSAKRGQIIFLEYENPSWKDTLTFDIGKNTPPITYSLKKFPMLTLMIPAGNKKTYVHNIRSRSASIRSIEAIDISLNIITEERTRLGALYNKILYRSKMEKKLKKNR